MADAPDSKSGGVNPREGSSPSSGTTFGLSSIIILVSPPEIELLTFKLSALKMIGGRGSLINIGAVTRDLDLAKHGSAIRGCGPAPATFEV